MATGGNPALPAEGRAGARVSRADLPRLLRPILVAIPAAGLALGLSAAAAGAAWSGPVYAAATVPVLAVLLLEIVTSLRRGDVGLDVVAALSMTAALAFGEHLAAVVVALMYAGGQYLESFAERRAGREMTALLARVPRSAMRHRDGRLEEVALDAICPGDRLLVGRGDVVPVDGRVEAGVAVLDEAALTGEALPAKRAVGQAVMSGSTNVGDAFDLSATRSAAESTYAGIVRLVDAAQRSKAPMSRLADRYAMAFLALTVALAGGAWIASGDPIRALAVLVVATPCPLILAVPVAIVSGMSRAARMGVLVKGGQALETLARVKALVIDKTGTLTYGQARLVSLHPEAGFAQEELLRIAASLDQASGHVVAKALVAAAAERGLSLSVPLAVTETPGEGLQGTVAGRAVMVGGRRFVESRLGAGSPPGRAPEAAGMLSVAVAVDGRPAGTLVLADELREGAAGLLRELRGLGVERIVLATGDRRAVAEAVGAGLPLDAILSELTPERKVAAVREARGAGPVMMIGDGVNDAPALAAADLGVAMGASGAGASAEAAGVVLLVERLDRIVAAVRTAKRSRRIALESVYAGLGLSLAGMMAAALGYLTPVQGALIQEAIDVAVILNALRALGGGSAA